MRTQEIADLQLWKKFLFGIHLIVIFTGFMASAFLAYRYGESRVGQFGSMTLFALSFVFIVIRNKMLEHEVA